MKQSRPQQPRLRSRVAREAWNQTGGGSHGGTPRAQKRRERRQAKLDIRREFS